MHNAAPAPKKPEPKPLARLRILRTPTEVNMTLSPMTTPLPQTLSLTLYPTPLALPHPQYKTVATLQRACVREYGKAQGFDDAITCTAEGYLLETAFANLFWIEGRRLYTPSPQLPLYFGTTLTRVIRAGYFESIYIKGSLGAIGPKASVYCANSLQGCVPVERIGTRRFTVRPFL